MYHQRFTHNMGSKPYKCVTCGQAFRYPREVAAHNRQEHGARKLKCGTCDKTYASKYCLKRHEETCKEPEKTYKCEQCSKVYKSKSAMKQHMKAVHTNVQFI